MNVWRALAVSAAAAVLGCGGPEFEPVTVSVRAPDREGEVVPIAAAEFTMLPFDIDSLYRALERKNQAGPPPDSAAVQRLNEEFFRTDSLAISGDSLLAARQSALQTIRDRRSPEYRAAFQAFQSAQARRDSLAAARDSAEARFARARTEYKRARAVWEAAAWDGFPEAQERLYAGVPPPRDSTGAETLFTQRTRNDGTFTVYLAPRTWWVAGRAAVPRAVQKVYRWNESFVVEEEPLTVELTGDEAKVLNTF